MKVLSCSCGPCPGSSSGHRRAEVDTGCNRNVSQASLLHQAADGCFVLEQITQPMCGNCKRTSFSVRDSLHKCRTCASWRLSRKRWMHTRSMRRLAREPLAWCSRPSTKRCRSWCIYELITSLTPVWFDACPVLHTQTGQVVAIKKIRLGKAKEVGIAAGACSRCAYVCTCTRLCMCLASGRKHDRAARD